MGTIFTFFCFSLLLQMVYQALLDCARCFQGPVDASVSIIIAFFHVGRNYGRSQCISISLFSQISAISSNPSDKAKPKLSFNLQSTYQPLCLCPDQVLQRIKKTLKVISYGLFPSPGYFIIGQVEWRG